VRKRDGTIAAFMRDNGGPPQRIQSSESRDRGETWSPVRDLELPNPGSGVDVAALRNGHWVLVYNDTERGRHSLAVSLSEDEGRSWPWTRHLDRSEPGPDAGSYSYPSVIQAQDGAIHVTYSFVAPGRARAGQGRESIKHARFDEAWVRERSGT
jgi:predicted neuraminidase